MLGRVKMHYLRGWFPIDFMSTVPVDTSTPAAAENNRGPVVSRKMRSLLEMPEIAETPGCVVAGGGNGTGLPKVVV